ncbi:histone-lysine N-methyltransferase PRDM7-like, partial [Frankliniella occidentalis]|uniref:Histone-lysine N-methyltransferase PRDM7-like n=1 Tax=Frankliniella occidentalis TaxID=133901 RepID=A0A9C6X928_FRAOC
MPSDSESEFEDLKEYFPACEWREMKGYEKMSYRNAKRNYHHMQRCGLTPLKPAFMTRKLKLPKRQSTKSKPNAEGLSREKTKKRKVEDEQLGNNDDDLNWSPSRDKVKAHRNSQPEPESTSAASAVQRVTRAGRKSSTSTLRESQTQPVASETQTSRYPKRDGSRRTYTDVPDDDDFLFCDDCDQEWEGDCPEHGPLLVVADTE